MRVETRILGSGGSEPVAQSTSGGCGWMEIKVDVPAFVFGDNNCILCNTTASALTTKPLSGPKQAMFVCSNGNGGSASCFLEKGIGIWEEIKSFLLATRIGITSLFYTHSVSFWISSFEFEL